jgi:hypothetical protein
MPIPIPVPQTGKYELYLNYVAYEDYQLRVSKPTFVMMVILASLCVLPLLALIRIKNKWSWCFYLSTTCLIVVGIVA